MAFSGPATATAGAGPHRNLPGLRIAVFGLFFLFGGITSLNDVLIPRLKALFSLSFREAMMVQFAFFAAYFICSFPAGLIVQRIGYLRTAVLGLATMAVGCLLFVPAASSGVFVAFLGALFIVAAGITTVQVVANPLISILGPPLTAHSRLTFAQAFNSLGTTIMPWIGSAVILGAMARGAAGAPTDTAGRAAAAGIIGHAYVGIAIVLLLVAGAIWLGRNAFAEHRTAGVRFGDAIQLFRRPRFAFGTLGIFLYVGAEVSIGSLLVSFLEQPSTMGLAPEAAGKHVAFYWGGAMVGRFIGAGVLQRVRPGIALVTVSCGAIVLLALAGNLAGGAAGWALLAVGLMNAIMFPTIFALASEGLGQKTAEGSGLICMAIVGGALVPQLTGDVADRIGLFGALAVPAICYAIIAGYGLYARRPAREIDPAPALIDA